VQMVGWFMAMNSANSPKLNSSYKRMPLTWLGKRHCGDWSPKLRATSGRKHAHLTSAGEPRTRCLAIECDAAPGFVRVNWNRA
jgi:hypothetical protein